MSPDTARIVPFSAVLREPVLGLWQGLWGGGAKVNGRYFDWKFVDNPIQVNGPVQVAMIDDRVVGLAAAHGSMWSAGGHDELVPCLGDLIVAEDLRGSDVFGLLLDAAAAQLTDDGHRFAFDFASGRYVPFMVMRGWRGLGPFTVADRSADTTGARASRGPFAKHRPFREFKPGSLGELETSSEPRPSAMAALVDRVGGDDRLRRRRDEAFLEWRFINPLVEYRFVYAGGEILDGYVVLGAYRFADVASPVFIVDLEASSDTVRRQLLAGVAGIDFPLLRAWPRPGTDDEADLESTGFIIDRPTGRPTADLYRPTVLVRQLGADATIGPATVGHAADWDARMAYFDEI
jgi:hypothetical protein